MQGVIYTIITDEGTGGTDPIIFLLFLKGGGLYFVKVNPRVSATQYYFILCCIFTLNITPTDGAPAVSE